MTIRVTSLCRDPFFIATGEPVRRLRHPYFRWRTTLRRLAIRYRKSYAARHSSVSWDLMIGRNPLYVAFSDRIDRIARHGGSASN